MGAIERFAPSTVTAGTGAFSQRLRPGEAEVKTSDFSAFSIARRLEAIAIRVEALLKATGVMN